MNYLVFVKFSKTNIFGIRSIFTIRCNSDTDVTSWHMTSYFMFILITHCGMSQNIMITKTTKLLETPGEHILETL